MNLNIQKDMGRLEKQVAQLCQIVDMKLSEMNAKVEAIANRVSVLERELAVIEADVRVLVMNTGFVHPENPND